MQRFLMHSLLLSRSPIPVVDEVPKSSESVQTPETPGTSSNALSCDSNVERHHSSQASSSSSLSKFLVHPNTSALHPKDPKKNWGARVMTSAENSTMIEEKEQKKRQEAEEKEQRKKSVKRRGYSENKSVRRRPRKEPKRKRKWLERRKRRLGKKPNRNRIRLER